MELLLLLLLRLLAVFQTKLHTYIFSMGGRLQRGWEWKAHFGRGREAVYYFFVCARAFLDQ